MATPLIPVGFPKIRPVESGENFLPSTHEKIRFSEAKIISVLKRNERGEKAGEWHMITITAGRTRR